MVDETLTRMPTIGRRSSAHAAGRGYVMSSTDVFMSLAAASTLGRTKLALFLPIVVAIAGVAFIVLGGMPARTSSADVAATAGVDPIVTGSIMTPDERRQALIMLDR
jgi:hypothetical protein